MKVSESSTPLAPGELEGLMYPFANLEQLNNAESKAIETARILVRTKQAYAKNICSVSGLLALHKLMFSEIWSWAGSFRQTEKNIGVAQHQIQSKLQELCLNIQVRIANKDENWPLTAAWYHHTLVLIHSFPDGNGRHARIATELLAKKYSNALPTWGGSNPDLLTLSKTQIYEELRARYIKALRAADKTGNYKSLAKFMFS